MHTHCTSRDTQQLCVCVCFPKVTHKGGKLHCHAAAEENHFGKRLPLKFLVRVCVSAPSASTTRRLYLISIQTVSNTCAAVTFRPSAVLTQDDVRLHACVCASVRVCAGCVRMRPWHGLRERTRGRSVPKREISKPWLVITRLHPGGRMGPEPEPGALLSSSCDDHVTVWRRHVFTVRQRTSTDLT